MTGESCGMWTREDSGGSRMLAGAALREELLRFGADPLEVKLEEFAERIRGRARE